MVKAVRSPGLACRGRCIVSRRGGSWVMLWAVPAARLELKMAAILQRHAPDRARLSAGRRAAGCMIPGAVLAARIELKRPAI